jgi:hypothetical protein
MTKLLALVVLLYGAVGASAATGVQTWCSDSYGYDKPAEWVMPTGGPFVLRVGGKVVDPFEDYAVTEDDFIYTTIDYASEGIEYKKQKILIFRDRVFWPCDKK